MNYTGNTLTSVRWSLLPLACAVTFCWVAESHGQSVFTLKELIEQTRKTESRIRTVSVTMNTSNFTRRSSRTGPVEAKGNHVETWHVDSNGMGWSEGSGDIMQTNADGSITVSREEFSAVFDGKVGKRILRTFLDGNEHTFGYVEKRLKGRFESPLQFVERVSSLLESGGFEFADSKAWDGRKVVVLQKKHTNTTQEKSNRKTEIWIDPALQFTVVRMRQFKRNETTGDWEAEWSRDSYGHEQLVDGVWLPKKASNTLYQSHAAAKVENKYVFTDWKINDELEEGRLHLDFPPGIRVRNSK